MPSIWEEFKFSESPYRVTPLEPTPEDAKLFTPRIEEGSEFLTLMDCKDGCVIVVSGDAGIGKTSFVNIQQHLIETEAAGFGPKLIACRKRTPLLPDCSLDVLARRIVENALTDIEVFCGIYNQKLPEEATRVRDWISSRESTSGFQIGVGIFSFGKSTWIPPVKDASLETWCKVLETIALEARLRLKVDGLTVCLENAESVPIDKLTSLLMTLRDTFFVSKAVWWIVIGQSGLYWKLESLDRRVSQRIRGSGVELRALDAASFHDVIERRVKFYRSAPNAVSPLSAAMHAKLFEASRGEIRFALSTAETLMSKIVSQVRDRTVAQIQCDVMDPSFFRKALQQVLQGILIESQVRDDLANDILSKLAIDLLKPRLLERETINRLLRIGQREVQSRQFGEFGFSSEEEFLQEFLSPLCGEGILARGGRRGKEAYNLKGFAKLCNDFGDLEKVSSGQEIPQQHPKAESAGSMA